MFVFSKDGVTKIGAVTSGGFGPSISRPVAMGYVSTANAAEGTEVFLKVRDKLLAAQITAMPFSKTNYFRTEATK